MINKITTIVLRYVSNKDQYKLVKFISKVKDNSNKQAIYTIKQTNNLLAYQNNYMFVNLPINSKYYHKPLPTALEQAIKLAQNQKKLNQKCYLLQNIVELVQKDPKLQSQQLRNFMKKQLSKWQRQQGSRFMKISTVAWIIKKIGLKQQMKNLYQSLFTQMQNDQWYVDFYQTVRAVQAYCDYPNKQKRDQLFQKIQRNLKITITDVTMTYYQKICLSLVEAGRDRSPIWQKLQQFVMRNLALPYAPRTFFDIFRCFAITKNGSDFFYQLCQQVIYKGHLLNNFSMLRTNLGDFDSTGDYFAMVIETYAVFQKHAPFPLSADFLDYLYKSMLSSRIEFKNIDSLTKLIQNMQIMQYHQQQTKYLIDNIVQHKQFTSYHSLTDIQKLYFAYQGKYGIIPDKLKRKIQRLIIYDMDRNILPLTAAIQLVQFVISYCQDRDNDRNQMLESLNKTIQKKYKYLQYEQKMAVIQCLKTNPLIQDKLVKLFLPKSNSEHVSKKNL